MDANKLKEILYAYSAGCLDREDYPQLTKYLNSGSGMFAREHSDLQNIIALIPATLDIEQPNPKLKDKVARRLYRMRDETRAQKKPLSPTAEEQHYSDEKINQSPENLKEAENEDTKHKTPIYIPLSEPNKNESESDIHFSGLKDETEKKTQEISIEDKPDTVVEGRKYVPQSELNQYEITHSQELNVNEKGQYSTKSQKGLTYFMLSTIVSLALCSGLYLFMNGNLNQHRVQLSSLTGQVNALNEEISRLEKNQRVLTLLGERDTKFFNLDATESNTKGFGKLTFSSEWKEGVLQLYNMPQLKGNQVYQLWVNGNNQVISMGAFKMKRDVEYFSIDQLPMDQTQIVSFFVTLEDNGGAASPSKSIYLSGLVNKIQSGK